MVTKRQKALKNVVLGMVGGGEIKGQNKKILAINLNVRDSTG